MGNILMSSIQTALDPLPDLTNFHSIVCFPGERLFLKDFHSPVLLVTSRTAYPSIRKENLSELEMFALYQNSSEEPFVDVVNSKFIFELCPELSVGLRKLTVPPCGLVLSNVHSAPTKTSAFHENFRLSKFSSKCGWNETLSMLTVPEDLVDEEDDTEGDQVRNMRTC
jgi:hypothetical protein